MIDSYQAVYDAIRSRFYGDFAGVFERAVDRLFDMSNARVLLEQYITAAGYEHARPSAVFRPKLSPDGDKWCALYGDNLQDGVAGFGDTPEEAMAAFDKAWRTERTPTVNRQARGEP